MLSAVRTQPRGLPVTRIFDRAGAPVREHQALAALLLYLVVSLVIHRRVVADLNGMCACSGGSARPANFSGATGFMWALVWWPYAIFHGQNPLVSHVAWTPYGLNLARATSVPAAALAAAPLTFLWSPLVAYNVLSIVAPALGAFAAYRLCLYLTRAQAASVLAGYLYGFSSFELAHSLGLLHMLFTFVPPAVALLTLKRLHRALSTRRYVVLMSLLLIAQLLLSTEMLATMTCMAAVALLAGWIFSPMEVRARITQLLVPIAVAYTVTVIVCSPYLYYGLVKGTAYAQGGSYYADLLSFVVPTPITWLGGHQLTSISNRFPGNLAENGAYLGLPLIAIFVAFVVQRWRTVAGRVLLVLAAVAALWMLGPRLSIAGPTPIRLPAAVFNHLPVLNQVAPVRIAMYLALTVSVAAAFWLSHAGGRAVYRWGLAALSVVFLIPNTRAVQPVTNAPLFHTRVVLPTLFSTNLYRHYLHRDEIVLPLPFGKAGESALWQAQTHMYFRTASGQLNAPPTIYAREPIFDQLLRNAPEQMAPGELRSFIVSLHVSAVVVDARHAERWLTVLARLRLAPVRAGGLLVYDVPAAWAQS